MSTPGATTILSPLEPAGDGAFPVVSDTQVGGGAKAVADNTARDAIPAHNRTPGTLAVFPDGILQVWSGTAWVPAGGSTVTSAGITDATTIGKALLTAIDAAAARLTLALGDAAQANASDFAPTSHTHPQYALESSLGGAASLNVGTGAGTVAAGNDARFTDARPPTAHAASHALGSGDPITPASIGAEVAGTATSAVSTHTVAADPHGDRAFATAAVAAITPASIGAEVVGAAAAAVSTHTGAADPHGDRAFATAAVAAITPASIGAEAAGTTATHAALTTAHGESAFNATLKTSTDAPAARLTLGLPASATRTITHSSSPPSGGVAGDIHFQIP